MKIIFVDPLLCTGCRSCEIACSFEKLRECNPSRARIHLVSDRLKGKNVPVICKQCEYPSCKAVCPTGALYRDEKTNAIVVDENKCVGCRQCIMVCPFGAIDLHANIMGYSFKCDLCGGHPKCVEACVAGALTFVEETRQNRAKNRRFARACLEFLQKDAKEKKEELADIFKNDVYKAWRRR